MGGVEVEHLQCLTPNLRMEGVISVLERNTKVYRIYKIGCGDICTKTQSQNYLSTASFLLIYEYMKYEKNIYIQHS